MNGLFGGSPEAPKFKDRREAATLLVKALGHYREPRPLVIGIPRGGVVLAEVIARELGGDLDVALVRKLRAPGQPEVAIGSVTEQGLVLVNKGWESLPESYLRTEAEAAHQMLLKRRVAYTPHRPPIPRAGRVAVVVDDGIATGSTMAAAVRSLKEAGAARVVVATAVAPPEAVEALRGEAHDVICLATPRLFTSVSEFFEDFSEIPEEEVVSLLRQASRRAEGRPEAAVRLHHGNFGLKRERGPG